MTTITALTTGAALALLVHSPALADRPGQDWIDIGKAVQIAKNAGYAQISKIEADDRHWEGKGIKDGRAWEFHIDPQTGVVWGEHLDD